MLTDTQGSPFSVFLYDSVYLWAKTVDGVLKMNKSPRDGALILALAKTHVFQDSRLSRWAAPASSFIACACLLMLVANHEVYSIVMWPSKCDLNSDFLQNVSIASYADALC